jgi:outer membrane lipoprotein-sorting protein
VNILRRLPLSRLLILCAAVVAVGVSATALASALGGGPVPKQESLAAAVHDALSAAPVQGVSANIKLTDDLLEGANLASSNGEAGPLSSSPLVSGASGRLWASKDGRLRLELQAEKGDTQILYDGHTLELYDASTNTLYRYQPPAATTAATAARKHGAHAAKHARGAAVSDTHEVPSVAKIEEAISHLQQHAKVSGAQPGDVANQPAYTVRVSPKEGGSLFAGVELSWDANHGLPLRAAVYSSTSSSPVIELDATEISYGPLESSVFDFHPPAGAKVEDVKISQPTSADRAHGGRKHGSQAPKLTTSGHGPGTIAVLESRGAKGAKGSSLALPEGLPKVKLNGVSATQLATPLGTLLSFERSGVRFLLAGSVTPSTLQAVARGL